MNKIIIIDDYPNHDGVKTLDKIGYKTKILKPEDFDINILRNSNIGVYVIIVDFNFDRVTGSKYESGLDVCHEISAMLPDIPLILYTGQNEQKDKLASMFENGVDYFIGKNNPWKDISKLISNSPRVIEKIARRGKEKCRSEKNPKIEFHSNYVENMMRFRKIKRIFGNYFEREGFFGVDCPNIVSALEPSSSFEPIVCEYLGEEFYLTPWFDPFYLRAINSIEKFYILQKAFRDDEKSKIHNPEFTMMEIYSTKRHDTVDELIKLLMNAIREVDNELSILKIPLDSKEKIKYEVKSLNYLFIEHLGFPDDKNFYSIEEMEKFLNDRSENTKLSSFKCKWERAFAELEDKLIDSGFVVIDEFPCYLDKQGVTNNGQFIERKDIYYNGIEIGSGYDFDMERSARLQLFIEEKQKRMIEGSKEYHYDWDNIDIKPKQHRSLAIGMERLSMILLGLDSIEELSCFSVT